MFEDRGRESYLQAEALIVAHGSPADPAPQEAAVRALAAEVAALMPGWRVEGATLAAAGALEAALSRLTAPLIYPFFMAEGFFTRTLLPRRLVAAGAGGLRRLPAFGHAAGLDHLCARVALDAVSGDPRRTTLLVAAHGSKVARASANGARAMAARIAHLAPFGRVLTGFVEEAPYLWQSARGLGPAVCLPFFALRAGHVAEDVPQMLAAAGFRGTLLPAIGEHRDVPALIARALQSA
jgi:sirohydrochlorin ferrochelatase